MTGTFTPSAVLMEFRKSATRSSHKMNLPWFLPPGMTERTAVVSDVSHESLPVTGLSACQLKATMPPRAYCASASCLILPNGTPSMFLSPPRSMRPRSNDITAGQSPQTLFTSLRPGSFFHPMP